MERGEHITGSPSLPLPPGGRAKSFGMHAIGTALNELVTGLRLPAKVGVGVYQADSGK